MIYDRPACHGGNDGCGWSQWLIKVVDRRDCDQSADCPEAGVRHDQSSWSKVDDGQSSGWLIGGWVMKGA